LTIGGYGDEGWLGPSLDDNAHAWGQLGRPRMGENGAAAL
jgi:hypothetical protein